jgi:hypothetical protein
MKDPKWSLRTALNDAYAFVQATEFTYGLSSITMDVLLQEELSRLDEGEVGKMPTVKAKLKDLENKVHTALEEIKKTDPQDFELIDEQEGAVT